jgi:hypothetical protein
MAFPHSAHRWLVLVERSALRLVMVTTGVMLMIIGLALGVSLVMLPPGVALGLTGVGVLVWGAVGDLPIDK